MLLQSSPLLTYLPIEPGGKQQLSLWMEFRCENLAFMPFQLHYGCLQV